MTRNVRMFKISKKQLNLLLKYQHKTIHAWRKGKEWFIFIDNKNILLVKLDVSLKTTSDLTLHYIFVQILCSWKLTSSCFPQSLSLRFINMPYKVPQVFKLLRIWLIKIQHIQQCISIVWRTEQMQLEKLINIIYRIQKVYVLAHTQLFRACNIQCRVLHH